MNRQNELDDTLQFNQGRYLQPFQRQILQKTLEKEDLSRKYRQRLQIMLLADEGKTQSQISCELGCSRVTVRHWMLVASEGAAHHWNTSPLGRPKNVNDEYLRRLKELVSRSPKDFGYAFGRWTAEWLSKHLAKELGVKVGTRHVNRLLGEMGLSTRGKNLEVFDENQHIDNKSGLAIADLTETASPDYVTLPFTYMF